MESRLLAAVVAVADVAFVDASVGDVAKSTYNDSLWAVVEWYAVAMLVQYFELAIVASKFG